MSLQKASLLKFIFSSLFPAVLFAPHFSLASEESLEPNHLIGEKSPYLEQHAYNPVDWYPWGEEAFRKAKKENKPIFLSIGYSTCHWCHVMEEESFTNQKVADVLNEHFVSIKVDREERPDVDNIYMMAVQKLTGSGGWPLSVFLTPELKPFYGGTYFPPEDRWGKPGFLSMISGIAEKWLPEQKQIVRASESLVSNLKLASAGQASSSQRLDEKVLEKAFNHFDLIYDSKLGGFGTAPKFPGSHTLSFLLRYAKRSGDRKALVMVEKTLQAMARGGIYDHLGGGFHRYSTDARWHIPHFEKMLYDQALLSKTYLEAYQATGKEDYADSARAIFEYVLGDMKSPEGAFYSAEDADSALDSKAPSLKAEGAFYVWESEEIKKLLRQDDAEVFSFFYGVKPEGNAKRDPHGEFKNKNILFVSQSIEETAKKFGLSSKQVLAILKRAKKTLLAERNKRVRPSLDDKVLTDWNGLMISSLAFGSRVLEEPRYLAAATQAADFLLKTMKRSDGRLMHRYREGEVGILGFIEDYAFFTNGLFDLYEASFDSSYLKEATLFLEHMHDLFWDEEGGGFFFSGKDGETLITQTKELYDGAIPSGNSMAAYSLLRVGRLMNHLEMEAWARQTLDAFSEVIYNGPSSYPQMLIALDFAMGPSREIILAGKLGDSSLRSMISVIFQKFLPNKVVGFHPEEKQARDLIEELSPFMTKQKAINGKSTAYVCKDYICDLPTTDIQKLESLLVG